MKTVIAGALATAAVTAALAMAGAAAAWPTATGVSVACPAAHHAAVRPIRHQVVFRHAPGRAYPAAPGTYLARTAYGAPPPAAAAYGAPAYGPAAYGPAPYSPAVYGPAFQGGIYVRPTVVGGPVFVRPGFHRAVFARGSHRPFAHPFFRAGFRARLHGFHAVRVAWRGEGHRFFRHTGPHRFG